MREDGRMRWMQRRLRRMGHNAWADLSSGARSHISKQRRRATELQVWGTEVASGPRANRNGKGALVHAPTMPLLRVSMALATQPTPRAVQRPRQGSIPRTKHGQCNSTTAPQVNGAVFVLRVLRHGADIAASLLCNNSSSTSMNAQQNMPTAIGPGQLTLFHDGRSWRRTRMWTLCT